jgi:hypothetical protein
MTIDLRVVSAPGGGWTVALEEQSLAGFYGPDARRLAESHRDGLVELLNEAPEDVARHVAPVLRGKTWIH